MLDIRWLEDLIALAETGSFTRAADRRNVTQSGFSRRIQSLEQWARAPLVDRAGTPLRLTNAGYEVLGVAQSVVGEVTHLRDRLTSHAASGRSTTIRIAALTLWVSISFRDGSRRSRPSSVIFHWW
ncbi:LysR family transcriptional regulator [Tistrella bauzanensis]